jgi:hypothetical protein
VDHARSEGWKTDLVHIDNPEYWLPEISHVFHGRDIFAPVAAHLASGVSLSSVGTPFDTPILLSLPLPTRTENALRGEVIYIDRFGSLVTNIRKVDLAGVQVESITVREREISEIVNTFGERPPGSLVVLFSSTGDLIISVVNGSAAQELCADEGDEVSVNFQI